MDKNTIIGLLLITAIIIGFSIFNRPTKEQLETERRMRDSIAQVEKQRAEMAEQQERAIAGQAATEQSGTLSDFFATGSTLPAADSVTTANVAASGVSSAVPPPLETEKVTEASAAVEKEHAALSGAAVDSAVSLRSHMAVLENDRIRLLLNPWGGSIYAVQLKEFLHHSGDSLYLFEGDEALFNLDLFNRNSVRLSTRKALFTPIRSADGKSVVMRLQQSPEQYVDLIYTLTEDAYMMDFDVRVVGMKTGLHPETLTNFRMEWQQKIRQQEKGRLFENRFTRIHYMYAGQDVKKMSEAKNDRRELTEPLKWFSFKDQYFMWVVIGEQPFNNTILTSEVLNDPLHTKDYRAEVWAPCRVDKEKDLVTARFRYYLGPVHYNTLKAYDRQVADGGEKLHLQENVYLGYRWLSWVNKWLVIPVFNFFLSLNWNMGLIILLLTLMVKLIILPLTYKSYMSSAKMRVLRPQVMEIEKKYPGKEQDMMMKRQQATMELYNRVGVSPMSGCLPMLIQMPVLLALFFFFPSAIELRQQRFLWASDLSTYDSIISWSGNIPIITRFLGNHISIFCLLMTAVNIVYTKYNMSLTDTGQQTMAGMKYMPIFMSVFMFFFLNNYPAGLNYYYFLSSLIAILVTILMKNVIDENKILAQLEENKKKPKKKSGFMARLAEAQKLQEKQARERAKENAKRNYRR